MQRFSKLLSRHIEEKGVSVSVLSKESKVERTSIYKMMSGDRKPPDLSVAERLANALLLSASEKKELLEACRIEQMGESVYRRRSAVLNFFNSFDPAPAESNLQSEQTVTVAELNGVKTAYGNLTVYNLIREIIDLENQRPDAMIRVLAQPDRGLLFDYLPLVGAKNRNLSIEHILCLENGRAEENGLYNFNCLTKLLSLFAAGCTYQPYYFYDHVASRFSETGTLPFFVLTHTHVIAYSCDETKAAVSDDPQMLELYRHIFDDLRQKCETLAHSFSNVMDLVGYWLDTQDRLPLLEYSFSYQPCLLPLLKPDALDKYVNRSIIQTDEEIAVIDEYLRGRRDVEWYSGIRRFYFSESSLDDFLRDGRVLEIPDEFYHPLDVPDRRFVLSNMITELEADHYHASVLRPNLLHLSPFMACGAYNDSCYIDIVVPKQRFLTLVIEERSVVSTLKDFFEYLDTNDLVCSKEETLAILKSKLERF